MATKKKPGPAYLQQPQTYNWGDVDAYVNSAPTTPPAAAEGPGALGRISDLAITGIKGAIGVPEAAVGLADIATGGRVGKFLENEGGAVGFRPEEAKKYLDTLYTPQQQAAFRAVQQAANPEDSLGQRIVDTGIAAIQNPSTIVHAVGESLPSMAAGGLVARQLARGGVAIAGAAGPMRPGVIARAVGADNAALVAGGLGEGVVAAGAGAEQMRQQTEDGHLTMGQSAIAAGSGLLTAGIGIVAAKAAKSMGIGDIDTLMAGGGGASKELQKGFTRQVLEGAFTEGVLEELPQSVQEQVAQNYALGKPLDEGVDQAVVMGALSGGAMGAAVNVLRPKVPEVGTLSRAANLAAGGIPPAAGPGGAPQAPTPPAPTPLSPVQEQELAQHANQRMQALELKAKGRKGRMVPGPDGKPIQEPDVQPEFLTPAEKAERDFLTQAGGDVQALARAYPDLVKSLAAPPIDSTNLPPVDDEAAIARMEAEQRRLAGEARGRAAAGQAPDMPVVSGAPRPPEAPTAPTAPTGGAAPRAPEAPTAPVQPPVLEDIPMADQDDILNPAGEPFKERFAANRKRANLPEPDAYQIVQVQGGFAIRRDPTYKAPESEASTPPAPPAAPIIGGATAGATIGEAPIMVQPKGTVVPDGKNVIGRAQAPAEAPAPAPAEQDSAAIGEVLDSDILNPKGEPFKEKVAAQVKAKQFPGSALVEVFGGWVVRTKPQPPADPLVERQPGGTRGTTAADVLGGNVATSTPAADEAQSPEVTDDTAPGAPTAEAEAGAGTAPTGGADAAGERGAGDIQAPGLTGEPIDSEWTAFAPESGTKGIPRADMPQIKAEHRGAMVQFLKARGIAHEQEADVDPATLKPTQAEYAPGKVQKAREYEGGNRAILVSSDGHVLDGHHQWMAAITDGTPLRVIRLDAPIEKLIDEVRQMPSAGTSDGATTGGTTAGEQGAAEGNAPAGDTPPAPPAPEPVTGGTTAGEPKQPKEKAEPKPPAPPRPEIDASTPVKPADVKRALDSQDDETKAKFADGTLKTLDGTQHMIAKDGDALNFRRNADAPKKIDVSAGYSTPTAEREHIAGNAKAAQAAMARMVEGSDAQGIAEALYEGIREVETDDLPLVFAEDRMIRLPVKLAEREKLDAALKKLKFRVTDRSQETDKSERMVLSAIHFPDKATIGDSGVELDGKMKGKTKPEAPPKDATKKVLDDYLDALRQHNFLDPEANQDASFASMMFKEALMENIKGPLDYIVPVMQRNFYLGSMKGRAVIADALNDDKKRATLDRLAGEYVERMRLLQTTLTPAKTTAEAHEAFKAAYLTTDEYSGRVRLNEAGDALSRISKDSSLPGLANRYAGLFANDADTDQTHRVKKKDPDQPPRLDRIVRVGMKDHRAGRNVSGEKDADGNTEFERTFGFKGLEFGEWVNQIERQQNLNLAYDSLMDMADITGLSPKQIGIASRLGMAIGARGQKITSAAAHFEPSTNVINLTKTQGNGTVGHEWFHGLDHNAGAMQGDDSAAAIAARHAVEKLAENLQHRWKPEAVESYLRGLLQDASASKDRNLPPKDAVFNAVRHPPGRYSYGTPAAYQSNNDPTRFYQDARAMDTGGERYWSKPVELLARGFETFIFDKSKGGSPYLVSPTRADGFMTAKNGYKGTPYPTGKEREYVAELYKTFIDQIDPDTLKLKPFKIKARVVEVEGLGFAVVDQYGADPSEDSYRLKFRKTKEEAEKDRALEDGEDEYLNVERLMVGKVNEEILRVTGNIDAIMEEMGIFRWPEIKNGTMAESMFYHLRQGWWPENNAALIEYAAKAHRVGKGEIDRLKQKYAQEDFEAALGRYATQRVQDMRSQGSDDRAIYDYLVGLYEKQPNLDVQTGTSMSNQAYSTPVPIGFIAGLLVRSTNSTKEFDPTGGNGLLLVGANPKNVITIELEDRRAKNLGLMQYGKIVQGDAVKLIDSDIRAQEVDAVRANPPFGSLPKNADVVSWDGTPYELSKIDHLIAAKSLKAMADGGRAVLILGAHPKEGAITSGDRVFLNWLYNNYNVADHFEIDGKMYSRQGASWPIRVLVIAGRKQTLTFYPMGYQVKRVFTFDQLWSRYDEARANSEQVLVGAGKKPDQAGGGDQQPGSVPGGSGGKTAGPGGSGGDAEGAANGPVVDGTGRGGAAGDGRPGATGGATAGDGKPGGNGQGGRTVAGEGGQPGGRGGSRVGAAGTDAGGLSDLSDDDIERLINEALGGGDKKAPRAPKGGAGPVVGGSTGGAGEPRAPRGGGKPKMGTSILDGIPGLDDLFGELGAALEDGETPPDDTPPAGPGGGKKERKKRETAIERRDRLVAEREGESSLATQAFMPKNDGPLLLGYTPAPALNGNTLNLLGARQHSTRTLVSSIRAALDYQLEQEQNPTAPNEKVSSRVMYSRQLEEDAQYAKVQPIFSRIWQVLSTTISDIGKRIQAFAVGVTQKFGAAVRPLVSRFVQDVRDEQNKIPDRKTPIRADAIDNESQVVYRGRSRGDSSGIFVPSKQAAALDRAFDIFEARHGDIDEFVQTELGYATLDDMFKGPKRGQQQGLAGYQVDALALAIGAIKDGNGFIIGDDTGVGKGRAGAALIAWAARNDKVPIFMSFKKDLYSAMAQDLIDIGKEDVTFMVTDSEADVQSRSGKVLLKNSGKGAKDQIGHILETGKLPDGVQAILTTYAQINTANDRRKALARLVRDGKAMLIMDESHNGAGDGKSEKGKQNTSEYLMGILTGVGAFGMDENGDANEAPEDWEPPPTVYLSATFAKRAGNMPLYVRTNLKHAAETPQQLVEMFSNGGEVMQQIASEYLVESGSMIRRERSYAGVQMNYVTDETNAPRDARAVDKVTEVLRQIVIADRAMQDWIESAEGEAVVQSLAPPGTAIANTISEDRRLDKSQFTSTVHNYIGQMLLATKVEKAVELAIAALNRGEKPVFALQNTMEKAITEYAEASGIATGDSIPGFGWQSMLKRGMRSAQSVTMKVGNGKKNNSVKIEVPTNLMPGYIAAEFRKISGLIEKFQSDLPGSPIDMLRYKMGQYFVVTGADGVISYTKTPPEGSNFRPLVIREITGREDGIDYSVSPPKYQKRSDPKNVDMILGYQGDYDVVNGKAKIVKANIDALILNSSGSTGISLHASVNAEDQRPRHMIVLQPNPDIAVFKQTLGRIHRTGQVEWPFFTVLATGIPAERRLLAVLKKKIGFLFSNTSGGEGSTGVDAVDFINIYGDSITQQYLKDNPEVASFIGVKFEGDSAAADLALTASGRASLLSVQDQQAYFDTIEEQFLQEIEMRNATGTNVLNRRHIDLQADMVGLMTLEEGLDETNRFTSSAILGKYKINIVGDIPDAEKVRAALAAALNGRKPDEVVNEIEQSLALAYDEAVSQNRAELAEVQKKLAEPDITEATKKVLNEQVGHLNTKINGFAARRQTTVYNLKNTYPIGAQYNKIKIGDVEAEGVVIGYVLGKSAAKKGNPFAPSNITVRFQRNVPGAPVGIALSRLEASAGGSGDVSISGRESRWSDRIDDWFSLRSVSGGTEERYIAGGNLLRARALVKGGEVLLFTMKGHTADAPNIQSGILMPKDFHPEASTNTDFTIRYPKAGADYVLSVLRAITMESFDRYGDEGYKEKADAFAAAARFTVEVPDTSALRRGLIVRGPKDAFRLRANGSELRLTIDQGMKKLAGNKELKAITGDMAKKRGDTEFSMENGRYISEPAQIARLVAILARYSQLVVPEAGAPYAKELQQKHYDADNKAPDSGNVASGPGTPAASRSAARRQGSGQPVAQVQALVSAITARWKNAPRVVVVQSITDKAVPEAVRKEAAGMQSTGTAGAPEGFYNPADNTVYLIADKLNGDADTVRVLMHESLGHYGMRGVYGPDFGAMLDRLTVLNSGKVRAAAARLGHDFEKQSERRMAAEEVLAYMAQNTPELGWVQRAIAAIRTWAREHIQGFSKMGLSDAEIIRDFILPARQFVIGGPGGGGKGGNVATSDRPMASRPLAAALESGMNSVRDVKLPAGYMAADFMDGVPGRLHWWHKSVGTMYHLAQKSPAFKAVYDGIQSFLNDVSYYATEAADLAPRILPKLDKATDALPEMTLFGKKIGKSPLSPEDTKAISAPIFEGTLSWGRDTKGRARPIDEIVAELGAQALDDKAHMLLRKKLIDPKVLRMWQGLPMDQYEKIIEGKFEREFLKPGVVFTPAELKEHFGLNDQQVGLYEEFRAATDKSITHLAITGMLKFGGKAVAPIREQVLATDDIGKAGIMLRDKLFELGDDDGGNKMVEKMDRAQQLIDKGYAPLSRFGQYTLDVVSGTDRVYFGLFESPSERAKMARKMKAQFPDAVISQGTVSEEAYKLFAGVNPDTVELLGEMLGLDATGDAEKDKAFQEYLKVAKSSRDSMKRLIKRKGIAGFSEDAGRVLAGFVYSNARQTASNLHMGGIDKAVNEIPKGDGQLQDVAVKLREYVKNPQEEAQAFRAALFAQYLGGSIASAMINATQLFAVTFPYLSQFGGVTKAARQMAAAVQDATKDSTGDKALDAALKKAEEEGIVSPQEVHSLMAQAMGRAQLQSGDGTTAGNAIASANNGLSKLSLAWGKVFGVAEQFNRRTTFIAAYRTAIDQGIADPAGFAAKAIAETQFTYNKGNKPRWARGLAGSILFTFKQYSVNYVELLVRMGTAGEPGSPERKAGQRAALLALAVLFLLSGADGLPFVEDVQDVIDGGLQRLGYNVRTKQAMKEVLAANLGRGGAEFVMNGLTGIPGVPIDLSGRLGMGNLIPGTGLFQKKPDHSRDLMELAGPAGDLVKRGFTAAEQALSGDVVKAATTISPVAARNVVKGIDMADTGMYRDDRGRKVIETTLGEAIAKGVGFQPQTVKNVQDAGREVQRSKATYQLAGAEIREKWALAMFEGDRGGIQAAKDDLAAWNRQNPEQPMKANMPAILRRVQEMRKSKAQRIADTAPKAIREQARRQLEEELK